MRWSSGAGKIVGEARPVFADFKKGILIGRFVPSGYDMPATEVATRHIRSSKRTGARAARHFSREPGRNRPMGRWECKPLWSV